MIDATVQIRKRGVLTLPAELRQKYDIEEGDTFRLVDLVLQRYFFAKVLIRHICTSSGGVFKRSDALLAVVFEH